MKIDFTRLDDLNARITMIVEPEDYNPRMEESLRKYSKKVALKGFRSGKTPKSVLTKMYGKGMLEEAVQTVMAEKLTDYLQNEKIDYFGSPMMSDDAEPQDFNIKSNNAYTFSFDLGLKPSFDVLYKLETPLDIAIPGVDGSVLDEEINHYRRMFGQDTTLTEGVIEDHDKVILKLYKPGEETTGQEGTEVTIDLGRITGEGKTILPGKKIGDNLDLDLVTFTGYDRKAVIQQLLHAEEDPMPDMPLKYDAVIQSIARPQRTELTGEQLSAVMRTQVTDENAFRDMLKERMQHDTNSQAREMKKMALRLALLTKNPFEVPEGFLLKWINREQEKKIEVGSRQAKRLIKDLKWSHILTRIAEAESLEVTEEDIRKQVTQWVVQNVDYRSVDLKKMMERLYANEYFMSSMKDNALEEVVFSHLLPQTPFTERTVSNEEFEKAFHDVHHELFDHDHSHDHDHDHAHAHADHHH